MDRRSLGFVLICLSLFSSMEAAPTSKESLALRRIAEFWKDGDFEIAKRQILEFLNQYPASPASDNLYAMLGDLYFQEKKYEDACISYEKISGGEFKNTVSFNLLYSYYQKNAYDRVIEIADTYFKQTKDSQEKQEVHFLVADSLIRLATKEKDMEKQKQMAGKALLHYEQFENSKYKEDFLFTFCEMQKMLKNYSSAIDTYLALAEKHPQRKEDLLFQAAVLQCSVDKYLAIETFEKIADLNGKHVREAVYNELVLLAETKRFNDFINFYSKYNTQIPENKLSLIQFYAAKSHFSLGHYLEAAPLLVNFVSKGQGDTTQMKNALVCLVNCAQNMKDLALLNLAIEKLKASFPNDDALPTAMLIHAQLALELKDSTIASTDLETLLQSFPKFGKRDAMSYASGVLLSQEGKWEESRKMFTSFLMHFPNDTRVPSALRYCVNCSLKLGNKEYVATDLAALLSVENEAAVTSNERREFRLLLSKVFCDTEKYSEALKELEKYINDYAYHETVAEAHLLAASCHQKLTSSPEAFIFHAEKVLSLNPNTPNKNHLHLHLFNSYLVLGEHDDKAAEHLYEAFVQGNIPIKWENQLWLTNYYLDNAPKLNETEKTKVVFQKTWANSKDDLVFEPFVLKYVSLLGLDQTSEKISYLEILAAKQRSHSELGWKYQKRTEFELAKAYEEVDNKNGALQIYNELLGPSANASSYTSLASQLHRSRIQLESLPLEKRKEDDPEMLKILLDLKELQIKKNIKSEPLHLEAALDYAAARANLYPADQQNERYLFFLSRIKEDFSKGDDIASKDYTTERKQIAEKDQLFQTYMKFIDIEMKRIKGEEVNRQVDELLAQPLDSYLRTRITRTYGK